MKIEAVRKLHFCAGHRVYKHESKCANLHGHNYVLLAYAQADELDPLGRVVDFAVLKEKIGGWLDEYWDHNFLIFKKDKEMKKLETIAPKTKPWYICDFNPTAEMMATHLIKEICPKVLKGTGVTVTKIELWETENCKVVVKI